jgi:hypothetical protein
MKKRQLINSGTVFTATLMVAGMLSLIVYLTGLNQHRSLYLNSLLSTTIISVAFMAFITTGLYRGWKLKDTIGKLTDGFSWQKLKLRFKTPDGNKKDEQRSGVWSWLEGLAELPGESVEGFLGALLLWIIVGVVGAFLLWWLGAVLWGVFIGLAAVLYWVVFRAYRLIFFYSPRCKGKLGQSIGIALLFTFLYNCWIYALILGAHYLGR